MTQQELGIAVGLNKRNARERISQYERGARNPKDDVLKKIAHQLEVHVSYLTAPSTYSMYDTMHILFTLEMYENFDLEFINDIPYLKLINNINDPIIEKLKQWYDRKQMLKNKEISLDEYYDWIYNYPMSIGYFGIEMYEGIKRRNPSDEKDQKT